MFFFDLYWFLWVIICYIYNLARNFILWWLYPVIITLTDIVTFSVFYFYRSYKPPNIDLFTFFDIFINYLLIWFRFWLKHSFLGTFCFFNNFNYFRYFFLLFYSILIFRNFWRRSISIGFKIILIIFLSVNNVRMFIKILFCFKLFHAKLTKEFQIATYPIFAIKPIFRIVNSFMLS